MKAIDTELERAAIQARRSMTTDPSHRDAIEVLRERYRESHGAYPTSIDRLWRWVDSESPDCN